MFLDNSQCQKHFKTFLIRQTESMKSSCFTNVYFSALCTWNVTVIALSMSKKKCIAQRMLLRLWEANNFRFYSFLEARLEHLFILSYLELRSRGTNLGNFWSAIHSVRAIHGAYKTTYYVSLLCIYEFYRVAKLYKYHSLHISFESDLLLRQKLNI